MGFFDDFSGGDEYSIYDTSYADVPAYNPMPDTSYASDPMGNMAIDNDFTLAGGGSSGAMSDDEAWEYLNEQISPASGGGLPPDDNSILARLKNMPLSDVLRMGGGIYKIWQGVQSGKDMSRAVQDLRAAQAAGNPLSQARITAAAQANQMMQDPMSYMSSPLAQMQIDQLNRAARAKQASLGQTWNIGADGGIQGSGVGAVDFAKELQGNLAKQYETALMNRAAIGGMNLFPNPSMYSQTGSTIAGRDQVRNNTMGAVGDVATTAGRVLFPDFKMGDLFGA